jgi:hypothetical protein
MCLLLSTLLAHRLGEADHLFRYTPGGFPTTAWGRRYYPPSSLAAYVLSFRFREIGGYRASGRIQLLLYARWSSAAGRSSRKRDRLYQLSWASSVVIARALYPLLPCAVHRSKMIVSAITTSSHGLSASCITDKAKTEELDYLSLQKGETLLILDMMGATWFAKTAGGAFGCEIFSSSALRECLPDALQTSTSAA